MPLEIGRGKGHVLIDASVPDFLHSTVIVLEQALGGCDPYSESCAMMKPVFQPAQKSMT
jgi:hypothetical protein